MQPASASYGKETTSVVSDEDEEDGRCDEDVAGQESRTEYEKLMISPGQVDAVSVEVQQGMADTGATSSEYN